MILKGYKKRIGIIEIPDTYKLDFWLMKAIFKDALVFDIQEQFHKRNTLYRIHHESFEKVEEGEIIPIYEMYIQKSSFELLCNNETIQEDIQYKVTFIKKEY